MGQSSTQTSADGGKIGVRESSADGGGLVEFFIEEALKEAGVNPQTEVERVQDPVFGYRNAPAHLEMLRSGKDMLRDLLGTLKARIEGGFRKPHVRIDSAMDERGGG